MKKYTDSEVEQHLTSLPGWVYEDGFISKKFVFKDFSEAFAFIARVALIQEQLNHHANWSGVYNKVTLKLQTHDAGGITEKDITLAGKVGKMMNDE